MLSYLWKRTSRVTCVTLVLWVGNETLRLLPSSSRCRQDSFRQRNLRSGWRVRQYDLTTSLRQRRRRAISQWIGVILYGFSDSVRSGRSRSVQRSVSFPTQRTRVTQVTRDVFMSWPPPPPPPIFCAVILQVQFIVVQWKRMDCNPPPQKKKSIYIYKTETEADFTLLLPDLWL